MHKESPDIVAASARVNAPIALHGGREPHRPANPAMLGSSKRNQPAEVVSASELLTAIVDSSDDAIISKNLDGIITSWNKGAERLFGYAADEAIGQPITMLLPPERLGEEPTILERLRRGERIDHFETIRVRKDGARLNVSLTVSPVRDNAGRIVGASKIARDITERKQAELELRRHRDHLEELVKQRTAELSATHERLRVTERLSSIGTLSAGLGHDIGNVMMPMSTHVGIIEAKLGAAAEALREHFDAIHRSIEYLQSLASGLRMLAIDPSLQHEGVLAVDLREWWKKAQPLLTTALSRRFALTNDFEPALPRIRIPHHLLTQAVFNLVQNAAQAMATVAAHDPNYRGRVRITAKHSPEDGWIILSVADNGPGMTAEVRSRCLEPFFSTKTRGVSTGLGLALVHGIVQNAGGSIDVQSEPGLGATFTLKLPAAARAESAPRSRVIEAIVRIHDARVRAIVLHELSTMNVKWVRDEAPSPGDAGLLIVGAAEERDHQAIDEFLRRNPHGTVVVLGTNTQERKRDERILHVGPSIQRMAVRKAIEAGISRERTS